MFSLLFADAVRPGDAGERAEADVDIDQILESGDFEPGQHDLPY